MDRTVRVKLANHRRLALVIEDQLYPGSQHITIVPGTYIKMWLAGDDEASLCDVLHHCPPSHTFMYVPGILVMCQLPT